MAVVARLALPPTETTTASLSAYSCSSWWPMIRYRAFFSFSLSTSSTLWCTILPVPILSLNLLCYFRRNTSVPINNLRQEGVWFWRYSPSFPVVKWSWSVGRADGSMISAKIICCLNAKCRLKFRECQWNLFYLFTIQNVLGNLATSPPSSRGYNARSYGYPGWGSTATPRTQLPSSSGCRPLWVEEVRLGDGPVELDMNTLLTFEGEVSGRDRREVRRPAGHLGGDHGLGCKEVRIQLR